MERFISWLKLKYPNGSTAKNYYTSFKSLVIVLADYGFIETNTDDLCRLIHFLTMRKARRTQTRFPWEKCRGCWGR